MNPMNANRKRKSEKPKGPMRSKRRKIGRKCRKIGQNGSISENKENVSATTILDLNDDCLREVFMILDINTLLNVIKTNSRFTLACEEAFKRKYCKNPISLMNVVHNRLNAHQLKHSVNILKHFGHLISKLRIRFKLDTVDSIVDAIAMNCGENLLELDLYHVGVRVLKPSSRYDSGSERMRSLLDGLSTQFVNLRRLKLTYCNVSKDCPYSDAIIQSIPSLTSFATIEAAYGQIFTEKKLKKFVKLNPQIETLSFRVDEYLLDDTEHSWCIHDGFIRYLDESLPMLKRLEINRVSTRWIPTPTIFPVRFKNLKELKFHSFLEFLSADVGFMSFLSDSVEVLKLSIFDFNITRFLKNVSQFKNLKVLNLEYPMDMMADVLDADQLARTVWTKYGIEQLILHNKNLQEISLTLHPSDFGSNILHDIYEGVTEYTDTDGHQWNLKTKLFGYLFHKVSD